MEVNKYIPKLIRASLDHDDRAIRLISTNLMRRMKNIDERIAVEIGEALDYNAIGMSAKRGMGIFSSPIDKENREDLLNIQEPIKLEKPIFSSNIDEFIHQFIEERHSCMELLNEGLFPTSSIILYGPPGVGKTYLAQYLAGELEIKFATLNLASSISSYLGKTGQNLKKILDYAKQEPTLLLLDEFDAVAKKRDDSTELGELKRIVNVLLKELEEWPHTSIIIAATNFPDILDRAIWRRFDIAIEIKSPEKKQRLDILEKNLYNKNNDVLDEIKKVFVDISDGMSADDICKTVERARKTNILKKEDINSCLLKSLIIQKGNHDSKFNKKICIELKKYSGLSIAKIAELIGKSKSTVQYYLR